MMTTSETEYEYYTDEDGYSAEGENEDMDWSEENPSSAPTQIKQAANAAPTQFKSGVPTTAGYKLGINFLKEKDLWPMLNLNIMNVADVLGISPAAASALLRQYDFSKEQLLEDYMQSPETVLKKAGVFSRCGNVKVPPPGRSYCPICYDDDCDLLMAMPCGHQFCMDCWYDFCDNAVKDGPACLRTTCPDAQCPEVVTEEEMAQALGQNSPQLKKFFGYKLQYFLAVSGLMRWCPGNGCNQIACAESALVMVAQGNLVCCDSCFTQFCLKCGEEPHAPISCKDLAKWNETCRNSTIWVLANSKPCPHCRTPIEKNGGCNRMTCSRCKHHFCWICMGDWSDHGARTGGYYKCNKFDLGITISDNSDAAKAKRDLDRCLHFYKRFHAHQEAQNFAKKQLKETEARMVQLQESAKDANWTDVEFLKTANEQLVECRRVLKYTCVFAFYMDSSHRATMQWELFEYHQAMLERFAEHLSELSKKDIKEMDRTDVVNQTQAVDRFMKNILKYVDDGMEDV